MNIDILISSFDVSPDDLRECGTILALWAGMKYPNTNLPIVCINEHDDIYGNSCNVVRLDDVANKYPV